MKNKNVGVTVQNPRQTSFCKNFDSTANNPNVLLRHALRFTESVWHRLEVLEQRKSNRHLCQSHNAAKGSSELFARSLHKGEARSSPER